jgi:hypothetical protein
VRPDVPFRSPGRPGAHAGAVALGLAILVVGLAGCGGGGDTSSPTSTAAERTTTANRGTTTSTTTRSTAGGSAESHPGSLGSETAVRTAVEAVLTSDSPAEACGRYVTQHFLSIAYGGRQGCVQAQTPESSAQSLRSFTVDQVGSQGTIATAAAVPRGGPYEGSKVVIGLVFDRDHYRVDSLRSNIPVGP